MKSPKKKEDSLYFSIPCIKLFLEDIDRIIEIMHGDGRIVEISDESFKYESMSDLVQDPKPLKEFELTTSSPYIRLNLKGLSGVSLSASRNGEAEFLKIKEVLQKNERWFSFLLSGKLFMIASLFMIISCLLTKIYDKPDHVPPLIALFVVFSVFIFALLFVLQLISLTNCFISINLSYSYKKDSFWARNRDQLLIAFFGAIAGVLLTIIVTAIVNNINS